jgi:hypothetical protein
MVPPCNKVSSSTSANVLLQGVHPGFHSVPLHHINLKSDFVLETVNSWSKTCTSCSGYFFSLLFGIDFAGGKVIMDPIVSEVMEWNTMKPWVYPL